MKNENIKNKNNLCYRRGWFDLIWNACLTRWKWVSSRLSLSFDVLMAINKLYFGLDSLYLLLSHTYIRKPQWKSLLIKNSSMRNGKKFGKLGHQFLIKQTNTLRLPLKLTCWNWLTREVMFTWPRRLFFYRRTYDSISRTAILTRNCSGTSRFIGMPLLTSSSLSKRPDTKPLELWGGRRIFPFDDWGWKGKVG